MMDIGASDGINPLWMSLAPYASFFGFEPDVAECSRLTEYYRTKQKHVDVHLYPVALGSTTGRHKFYLTNSSPTSDSMLEPNSAFWERFPHNVDVRTINETEIETTTLENVVKDNNISHIDFIKIDTEGMDYPILKSGHNVLRRQNVLGILTEFTWDAGTKKSQESFSEYDAFLRGEGFSLFDLECLRFPRNSLPVGHLLSQPDPNKPGNTLLKAPGNLRTYGQLVGGNALYFRDPIKLAHEKDTSIVWTESLLLKLVCLLDIYNYQDVAIEILDHYRDTFESIEVDVLIDALTPALGAWTLPYDQYFNISSSLFKERLKPKVQPLSIIPMPRYTSYAERRALGKVINRK
jgi:FkbM family methyltransferase